MHLERFDELEALRIAIQSKIDSYNFYKEALQHVQNKTCKELLTTLAEDERRQHSTLEKKYTRLSGKRLLYISLPRQRRFIRNIIPNSSELEVLEAAIQQESDGRDFFEHASRVVAGSDTHETFEELVKEEERHIHLLESEYSAQTKTEDDGSLKLASAQ